MMAQELKSKTKLKFILLDHFQVFNYFFKKFQLITHIYLQKIQLLFVGTEETDPLRDTGNTKKMLCV